MGYRLRNIFRHAGLWVAEPKKTARRDMRRLRNWLLGESSHNTPISDMQALPGLITAWWRSKEVGEIAFTWTRIGLDMRLAAEERKIAWALSGLMAALTIGLTYGQVWVAVLAGQFTDSLVALSPYYNPPGETNALASGLLLAAVGIGTYLIEAAGDMTSDTLNRLSSRFLNNKFNTAVLQNRSHVHLLYSSGNNSDSLMKTPDHIDQRIEEAPAKVMGNSIGLTIGALRVVSSFFWVGWELISRTVAVDWLPSLGDYGTLGLAFAAAAIYVPPNIYLAWKMGKNLENIRTDKQKASGAYRGEWNAFTRRSTQVAATNGEKVQKKIFDELYDSVNSVWHRENVLDSAYLAFKQIYNLLENRFVSYGPALPALAAGAYTLRDFVAVSELVSKFLTNWAWLINVMPGFSNARSYGKRLTEIAQVHERIQETHPWYAQNGIAEARIHSHDSKDIVINGLDVMMPGETDPFLHVGDLDFKPGQWTAIQGGNGTGKSTLMKIINGLWPYGRGDIYMPEGSYRMYAPQERALEKTTLKQIITAPDYDSEHSDEEVKEVLKLAGLEKYVDNIQDKFRGDKLWEDSLSGGEKQKIVLAQILLHKPDIIFLDEPTSAMDPDSKIQFHKLIKEHLPGAIVFAIIHDEKLLGLDPEFEEKFYDSYLWVHDGKVEQRDTAFSAEEQKNKGFMPPPPSGPDGGGYGLSPAW